MHIKFGIDVFHWGIYWNKRADKYIYLLVLSNNLVLALEGTNGSSIVESPECPYISKAFQMSQAHVETYFCTFAPCLALYEIRSFVVVMKMQFAKFSFQFDPTKIIKCLPACHSAILYILSLSLRLSAPVMNHCVWRLLFGFHSEVVTLTAWGTFCNHQFILVLCFALNCSMKMFFKYNTSALVV